ncbi:uroporphyrinogen decarboxylase family protein [Bradyrhizobium genosp. P]|uniref:uroporphyrinogen decarboxylase family protein n=1 Tax=Bradyrhizobium genosp. P TaxID=83641 RepID=UPI003CFBBE64
MSTNWRQRASEIVSGRIAVDIGTTSLTGVRLAALGAPSGAYVANPIYNTAALAASDCARLGADFQRVGFLHAPRDESDEAFVDAYGVGWLFTDGFPAPFQHPLQAAEWKDISRHPRPVLPTHLQIPDPARTDLLVVLDAPCPGLLDTCFALRNAWQFLDDLTGNWRIASATLDWATETIEQSYKTVLAALPSDPDVIVYGDDLGFQSGMYLSDLDFRTFVYPRMQTLFARLRRMTNAAICLHSCGAVRSIVNDLAGLDVEMLNLDFYAKNMILPEVRREIPSATILHGPINLAAVGEAVREGNKATLALLATEIAVAMPAIAAPIDNITSAASLTANTFGAAFVRALTREDLVTLRDIGPVRSLIDKARQTALGAALPAITQEEFPIAFGFAKGSVPAIPPIAAAAGSKLNRRSTARGGLTWLPQVK